MFFSQEVLSRKKNDLGIVWLMATLKGNRLQNRRRFLKKDISKVSVTNVCNTVSRPPEPIALRLTAQLLYGIIIVHDQQVKYLLNDAGLAHTQLLQQYSSLKLTTTKNISSKATASLVKENNPAFSINFGLLPEIPKDLLLGIDADTVMSMSSFNPFPENFTSADTSVTHFDFYINEDTLNHNSYNEDNMNIQNNEFIDFEFTETGEIAKMSKNSAGTMNLKDPVTLRSYNEHAPGSIMILPTLQEEEDSGFEPNNSFLMGDSDLMGQYDLNTDDIINILPSAPTNGHAEALVHDHPYASSIEIARGLTPAEIGDGAPVPEKNTTIKRQRAALFDTDRTWLDNCILKANQDDYVLNMMEIKKRRLSQGAARKQLTLMARETFVFIDNRCDKLWTTRLMDKIILSNRKGTQRGNVQAETEELQMRMDIDMFDRGQDEPEVGRLNPQFGTPNQRSNPDLGSSIEQARNTSMQLPTEISSPWSETPIKYNIIDGKRARDGRNDFPDLESPLAMRSLKSSLLARGNNLSSSHSHSRIGRFGSGSSLELLEEAPEEMEWDVSGLDLNMDEEINRPSDLLDDINFESQFVSLRRESEVSHGDAVGHGTNLFYNYMCKEMKESYGIPESADIPGEATIRFQDLLPIDNKDYEDERIKSSTRKNAASAFSHLLVLASRNYIGVSQESSENSKFDDIYISMKVKKWI